MSEPEDLVDFVDQDMGISVDGVPFFNVGKREVRTAYRDYTGCAWEVLTPAERAEWKLLLPAIHSRRLTIEAQSIEVRSRILKRYFEVLADAGGSDPFRIPSHLDNAMAQVLQEIDA